MKSVGASGGVSDDAPREACLEVGARLRKYPNCLVDVSSSLSSSVRLGRSRLEGGLSSPPALGQELRLHLPYIYSELAVRLLRYLVEGEGCAGSTVRTVRARDDLPLASLQLVVDIRSRSGPIKRRPRGLYHGTVASELNIQAVDHWSRC